MLKTELNVFESTKVTSRKFKNIKVALYITFNSNAVGLEIKRKNLKFHAVYSQQVAKCQNHFLIIFFLLLSSSLTSFFYQKVWKQQHFWWVILVFQFPKIEQNKTPLTKKDAVLVWNRCVELRGLCGTDWYSYAFYTR